MRRNGFEGSLLYRKPETTRGEKKEKDEERDEIVVRSRSFQLTLKIRNNNSVARRQENGHRWPKVFRKVSAILYRFIPRLTGVGGEEEEEGIEIKRGAVSTTAHWPSLEFPGQRANLSQCKLRYISPSRFDDFLSPVFQ